MTVARLFLESAGVNFKETCSIFTDMPLYAILRPIRPLIPITHPVGTCIKQVQ